MIPARPKIPAAIPPTTAPVEMVASELGSLAPVLVGEGLDVREVGLGRLNEVDGRDA